MDRFNDTFFKLEFTLFVLLAKVEGTEEHIII